MQPISIYIHIPFCRKRCAYCDFNTFAGIESLIPDYVDALCNEIQLVSNSLPNLDPIHSIYFGGGTPSLLMPNMVDRIMNRLTKSFSIHADCETSMEANPGTIGAGYLRSIRLAGINRLSLGVQTLNYEELKLLGRLHDPLDVFHSVQWAKLSGFDNISIDLIFGLPFQTIESWQRTLRVALNLGVQHISLYALTVEEGTPFWEWVQRGLIPGIDDDLLATMYDLAGEMLAEEGFIQYEISNWALRDAQKWWTCRHNLQYWRNLPYLGFGAGAHGYFNNLRTANVSSVDQYIKYIQKCSKEGIISYSTGRVNTEIDKWDEIQETMMLGLRLTEEGINREVFERRFGKKVDEYFGTQIQVLSEQGLIDNRTDRIRLTNRGRFLGNRVFMQFIGNPKP
jgi:oxygen-independent coproporphyrinogen-3 oxidase